MYICVCIYIYIYIYRGDPIVCYYHQERPVPPPLAETFRAGEAPAASEPVRPMGAVSYLEICTGV